MTFSTQENIMKLLVDSLSTQTGIGMLLFWQEFPTGRVGQRLRCAEQMFQCALHAYNPAILEVQQNDQEDSIGRAIHCQAAQIVSDLTKKVAQAVGWHLDLSVVGCGWSTPMREIGHTRSIWLRHDLLDSRGEVKLQRFMRASQEIEGQPQLRTVAILRDSRARPGFHISINPRWGIPDTTKCVNVIVEIAPKSRDHEAPYMRFPKFRPFTDWDAAAGLAIRLQWEVDGTWKTAFVQQEHTQATPLSAKGKPEERYLKQAYVNASELLESLLRFHYTDPLPPWKDDQPRDLHIRQVQYNHMEQCLEMRIPLVINQPAPRMRSLTDVHHLVSQHYGVGLIVGQMPPGLFTQRLDCDYCFADVRSSKLSVSPALTLLGGCQSLQCSSCRWGMEL
jgi:hypothetical protein